MTTVPPLAAKIRAIGEHANWMLSSDDDTGSFLRTLAASKPAGRFLEVGSGIGVGSAWLLAGMDAQSVLVGLEIKDNFATVARDLLKCDSRVTIVTSDASDWLRGYDGPPFDFAFIDTTIVKFEDRHLLYPHLRRGAIVVADDLLPQPKWTEKHPERVDRFRSEVMADPALLATLVDWASGLLIATFVG